jgi:hypothetical protein
MLCSRRRPWGRIVLLVVVGIVALVAAGLVVQTALTPHRPENFIIPPVPSLPGGATTPGAPGSSPSAAAPALGDGVWCAHGPWCSGCGGNLGYVAPQRDPRGLVQAAAGGLLALAPAGVAVCGNPCLRAS